MKKVIAICLLATFISCKNETKEKQTQEVIKEVTESVSVEKKPVKKASTLFEYIEFGDKSSAAEVNDTIGDLIHVKEVSLFKEKVSEKVFVAINLSKELEKGLYGKYRIIALVFPHSKEDLRPESIERGLDFDSWYFDLKTHSDGKNTYVWGQVAEGVSSFKKVILRIINLETGKKSEKEIVIEDLGVE
ncbi:hypothetical protein [Pseudofulvibacter geojedonensis]|uniref:Lipoprotein n=1 Tax=Pseudofulvibacter geojedonensis TaxID=1123758 RepID=A0ABW3I5D9_9FLAO